MTDKRQALIDAIQAIQQARENYGKKPGQLPPGEFPILVDPELDEPQHNTTDDLLDQDVEVEDPDNVLKDQKQQKQQRQQQKQQSNQQKQDNPEDEPEGQEEQPEEPDTPGNKNNKQNQKNEPGEEGEDSDPIPGEDEGDEPDDEIEDEGDEPGEDEGDEPGEDEPGEEGEDGKQGKNKENGHDPAYIKAWNEIMDRFDNDDVSEAELKSLISAIKSGNIDSI